MGWETRQGSTKRYYTLTWSVAGRRRRFYVGGEGDPVAEIAAAYDALHRVAVELDRRKAAAKRTAITPAQVRGVDAATAALTAALQASGLCTASPEPACEPPKPVGEPFSPPSNRD